MQSMHALPRAAAFCVALALVLPGAATAQESKGTYFGVSLGSTSIDWGATAQQLSNEVVLLGFGSASTTIGGSGSGLKLLVGSEITPSLALEGYYAGLGSYDLRVVTTAPVTNNSGNIDVTGFGLDVVSTLPMGESTSALLRAGLLRWSLNLNLAGGSGSDSGTSLKFGFGLQWKVGASARLRVEWERYMTDPDTDVLSAGLVFRF